MNEKEKEQLEKLKVRYKKQNDKIKDNYDRISVTLPKGTKEEITRKTGMSINAFINELVENELKKIESDQTKDFEIPF